MLRKLYILAIVFITFTTAFLSAGGQGEDSAESIEVVVTTNILGDIVSQIAGDTVQVTTLIAVGQDPHGYEPTPRDLARIESASAVFVNGFELEEGLLDIIESSNDVHIITASRDIDPIEPDDHDEDHDEDDHEDDHDEDHGEDDNDEDHHDEHQHAEDPHVWMDPTNIKSWVRVIAAELSELSPENSDFFSENAESYIAELDRLDAGIRQILSSIPIDKRVLVTDHSSFAYFARAYNFEVIGTIIPSLSSSSEPSARDIAELTEIIEEHGVRAIFIGETSGRNSSQLAAALTAEAGVDIVVSRVLTGSLHPELGPDYVTFMRYNAEQFASGLAR